MVELGPYARRNLYVGVCFWPEPFLRGPKRPAPFPPPYPILCLPFPAAPVTPLAMSPALGAPAEDPYLPLRG